MRKLAFLSFLFALFSLISISPARAGTFVSIDVDPKKLQPDGDDGKFIKGHTFDATIKIKNGEFDTVKITSVTFSVFEDDGVGPFDPPTIPPTSIQEDLLRTITVPLMHKLGSGSTLTINTGVFVSAKALNRDAIRDEVDDMFGNVLWDGFEFIGGNGSVVQRLHPDGGGTGDIDIRVPEPSAFLGLGTLALAGGTLLRRKRR